MAISPVYLNGAISATNELAVIKANEANKPAVDQMNYMKAFDREVDYKTSQVHESENVEWHEKRYDAKEKSGNQYLGSGKKKKTSGKDEKGEKSQGPKESKSSFDITI